MLRERRRSGGTKETTHSLKNYFSIICTDMAVKKLNIPVLLCHTSPMTPCTMLNNVFNSLAVDVDVDMYINIYHFRIMKIAF